MHHSREFKLQKLHTELRDLVLSSVLPVLKYSEEYSTPDILGKLNEPQT